MASVDAHHVGRRSVDLPHFVEAGHRVRISPREAIGALEFVRVRHPREQHLVFALDLGAQTLKGVDRDARSPGELRFRQPFEMIGREMRLFCNGGEEERSYLTLLAGLEFTLTPTRGALVDAELVQLPARLVRAPTRQRAS